MKDNKGNKKPSGKVAATPATVPAPEKKAGRAPASPPPAPRQPQNALFEKIKGREQWLLLAAMILGCIIVFKDFLTFEKVYLFKDIGSDSINIEFPGLVQLSEYIRANGVPKWSFSQGLGQNIFPFSLADFFTDIVFLFFNKDTIPYTLAYIEVIKILLCGLVFYKYLCELKLQTYVCCLVAFLYAFCGYIVLGSCWVLFSTEALYLALILLGFERWLNRGKWLWFLLGVFCMSFLQPFLLFPHALFLAGYITVRYNDVRPAEWKKFPLFIAKTIGLAVVGVAISAYQLLPDLLQYIESPRVGGDARLIDQLKAQPVFGLADEVLRFTTTFRMFGSDMLGSGSAFQGWQNYLEAPLFYCGILCLVTFPQIFTGLNKRQRIAYGILGGVFALPIFFPFFRYTFWAYTGDYFRTYSLVVTFLLLFFTARALHQIITTKKVNLIVLGVTVLFLLFLLYTPDERFAPAINSGMRSFVTLLIFVYAGILYALTRQGEVLRISRIVLMICCFTELIYFSSQTINERDVMTGSDLKDRIGYNDYTVDAVNYIKQQDKGFYRVHKDYSSGLAIHPSINDAKVQGYFGTASYYSFNQKNYIRFLGELGVIDPKNELATRWALGVGNRPLLFTLMSGKYFLKKNPGSHPETLGYDSIATTGDVKIYRNRLALPLGFAYHEVLGETEFQKISPPRRDLYLLQGCVVADDDNDLQKDFKRFNLADTATPFTLDLYSQEISALRRDGFVMEHFKESDIRGNITLAAPGILFFSIPFDEGWKATVNGNDAKIYRVNTGFVGLKLPAGKSEVELTFVPRLMRLGGIISIAGILLFVLLLTAGRYWRKTQ